MDAIRRTAADERFGDLRYIISDFLDVEGLNVREADMESVAVARIGSSFTNPRIRIALVTKDPDVARLKSMIDVDAYRTAYETKVLSTLEETRRWVDQAHPGSGEFAR